MVFAEIGVARALLKTAAGACRPERERPMKLLVALLVTISVTACGSLLPKGTQPPGAQNQATCAISTSPSGICK